MEHDLHRHDTRDAMNAAMKHIQNVFDQVHVFLFNQGIEERGNERKSQYVSGFVPLDGGFNVVLTRT